MACPKRILSGIALSSMALPAIWYLLKDGNELQRQKRKFEEQRNRLEEQRNRLEECVYNFEKQEKELKTSERYSDDFEIELNECGSDLTKQGIELKKCEKESKKSGSHLKKQKIELKKCGKKSQICGSDLKKKERALKKCEDKSKFEEFVPCGLRYKSIRADGVVSITPVYFRGTDLKTRCMNIDGNSKIQFECKEKSDGSFEAVAVRYAGTTCSGTPNKFSPEEVALWDLGPGYAPVSSECYFCEKE